MNKRIQKEDIKNLALDEIIQYVDKIDEKSYRATQIYEWIYKKGVWSFDEMKNLTKELREKLNNQFIFKPLEIKEKKISADGTTKFLFRLLDGQNIETVLIPTSRRMTVCVSTQAGCKFGCRFCASGIGGWARNLTSGEIITQMLHVKEEALRLKKSLSHVVFMGVGEPLDNYQNLMKAVRVINDKKGFNIGARRITVSTCGVIPKIQMLSQEKLQLELAISLHGFNNESRNVLMPVNRKYPFDELMKTCRTYIKTTKRQITFEYILIKDITCSPQAIQSLRKALKGLICKMNLIPYNPVSEFDYQTPTRKEMFDFQAELKKMKIHSTIRMPRGRDVSAACGQLRHNFK